MRVRIQSATLIVNDKRRAAVGVMCGEHVFRLSSWKTYPLFWKPKGCWGLGIGPILFWDGN